MNNIVSKVNIFRFDDETDEQVEVQYADILNYVKNRFT